MMKKLTLVLAVILCSWRIGLAGEFIQEPAAIQISSYISDGKYSIPEIVAISRENKFKIVIITDRDWMRWQYGLWPLRNVVKKTVEDSSISRYGISRYLKDIESVQKANPDMVIIPGVESAPLYYWQGDVFHNNLKIINWHKHMLAIGLDKEHDYQMLPVVSNTRGLTMPFRLQNIVYLLLPLLFLAFGTASLYRRKFAYKDSYGRTLGPYSRVWRFCGIFFVIIGVVSLWNNYPFRDMRFSQYEGNSGIKPYQNYIDYVNSTGALSFWAHPEAEYLEKIGNVDIETRDHATDLLASDNYTGFALFYEGYKKTGIPGGIWDKTLMQYCSGVRNKPVWAIGSLGFDTSGTLDSYLEDLRTVLLVAEMNRKGVLDALRQGRAYMIKGRDSSLFILDEFTAKDPVGSTEATMGQEVEIKNKVLLRIRGHFLNGAGRIFQVKLIKNGSIIKTFEAPSPFDILYEGKPDGKETRSYYRVDAETDGVQVVTNPIFVKEAL